MSLVLFDVLYVGGKSVMREPWRDRRQRLEDLIATSCRALLWSR